MFAPITVKYVVLKHQKRLDNTYNIKYRVTVNRESAYISTRHYITERQISKDFRTLKDITILDIINIEIKDIRAIVSKLDNNIDYDCKTIVNHIKNANANKSDEIDFITFWRKIIETNPNRITKSTLTGYKNGLKKLTEFAGDKLDIKEINFSFLKKYENHLFNTCKSETGRGIELNLEHLRKVFNLARDFYNDEDAMIIKIPHYPFRKYQIPTSKQPKSRAIEVEDLKKIIDYKFETDNNYINIKTVWRPEFAKDLFMLSFFLVGINTVDLYNLKKTDYKNGRITYNRQKTENRRKDNATISIKIEPEALPIFEKHLNKDKNNTALFIFSTRYSTHMNFNKNVNKGLKIIAEQLNISSNLQYYSARHTWATIARNECEISKDIVSVALNHSSQNNVTDMYIKKDWTVIDKANRKVIDYIKKTTIAK